ncbi:hypothetical protein ACFE04_031831 [Oxalis oulophora]
MAEEFNPLYALYNRGRKDLSEDLPAAITYSRNNAFRLNAIGQEVGLDLKEPRLLVYEDENFKSAVTDSSDQNHAQSKSAQDITKFSDEDGTNHERKEEMQVQPKTVSSKSAEKDESNTKRVQQNQNVQSRRRLTDGKIKKIKDQLIRAKAYLHMIPSGSNSQLVKELKQRSKDIERVLGESNKDLDLSRSASHKFRALEDSLLKASRIYPECSAMAGKLRAMTYNAEDQVKLQKKQADYLTQLAGRTTPKGLHCLSMRLTSEYFNLQHDQTEFKSQENLNDPDFYHYAVFSDNVLACAVVVNSTVSTSMEPQKIVFHVVTDSLNLPAISMWFLSNPPGKATIHIQSVDSFGWLSTKYNSTLNKKNSRDPRFTSSLNHLRFYLPDVFPGLEKIVLLDHDVVVQRDLSRLWKVNMHGNVNGAVETCEESDPSFHRMNMFINFSDPIVAERFDEKTCTWAFGMNLFDLQRWRRRSLTAVYHRFLHLGEKKPLYKAGSLPLGWMTFYNHTIALHKRWHILGLGYESGVRQDLIEKGAVIHYDGVMKPWLDTGIRKYKGYWSKHVNFDVPIFRECNIHE